MDGEWAAELAGEPQLSEEDGSLGIDRGMGNPLIQPALADGGARVLFQQAAEIFLPSASGGVGVPRVDAEGGKHEIRLAGSEFFDVRPIVLAGGVDDAPTDAGGAHGGDERRRIAQARVVQVVVRIDPHGGSGRRFG
jgi:hypothetical protein